MRLSVWCRGVLCAGPWLPRGCHVCPPATTPCSSLYSPLPLFPHQNNASKLLLAIMESRHDSENAERILYNMRPKELVSGVASLLGSMVVGQGPASWGFRSGAGGRSGVERDVGIRFRPLAGPR